MKGDKRNKKSEYCTLCETNIGFLIGLLVSYDSESILL